MGFKDVVEYPRAGREVIARLGAAEIYKGPEGRFVGNRWALLGVSRDLSMPSTSRSGLDLKADLACVVDVASEDVDAGHVAGERDGVAARR